MKKNVTRLACLMLAAALALGLVIAKAYRKKG